MGGNHLADVMGNTARSLRDREGEVSEERLRQALGEALTTALERGDARSDQLLDEISRVLQAVHGVGVALDESKVHAKALHKELVLAIAEFQDVRGMYDDLRVRMDTIAELTHELATARSEQRTQSTMTHRALVAITKLRQALRQPPAEVASLSTGPCPYPGLVSFGPREARWFYGREAAVAELTTTLFERLDTGVPVVIVAASGAGKSSLLHAGLLPSLAAGAVPIDGSEQWPRVVMRPGAHPLRELAARVGAVAGVPSLDLARQLRTAPEEFGALARQVGLGHGSSSRLVIVVDQFEEVFTQCADPVERSAFATALAGASPAVVVIAVRADFYEQCTRLEALTAALSEQFVLGPMSATELEQVIAEPARQTGLQVEPGLVDRMIADLGAREGAEYSAGALPLLAHALHATWQNRFGNSLTTAGYLATGGIGYSVAATAETVYSTLGEFDRRALRSVMLRLVTVGEDHGAVRRRVDRRELPGSVLEPWVRARLVTADEDTVQISHEALLAAWPRLRDWVTQDRQGLLIRRQLDDAVRYWLAHQRSGDDVLRGGRLASVQAWAQDRDDLTAAEHEFLAASNHVQQRATRRLRVLVAGLAMGLVAALGGAGATWAARVDAEHERQAALSRQLAAESQSSRDADPRGSMLRALRAWRASPTDEARDALVSASMSTPPVTEDFGDAAHSVDLTHDGTLMAVGHSDDGITLWDVRERRHLPAALSGHGAEVDEVLFSPDGSMLATSSTELDGVRIWSVPDGEPIATLPGLSRMAWHPNGDAIAAIEIRGEDFGVTVWHPRTGHRILELPTAEPVVTDVEFDTTGERLALGRGDGTFELWDLTTRTRVATGGEPGALMTALAVSGELMATTSRVGAGLRLWDVRTGAPVGNLTGPLGQEHGIGIMAFTSDGRQLVTVDGGTITTWDTATRRHVEDLPMLTEPIMSLTVSDEGGPMAVALKGGDVVRWERGIYWYDGLIETTNAVSFHPVNGGVSGVFGDGVLRTWNTTTGGMTESKALGASGWLVRHGSDGTEITATRAGTITLTSPSEGPPRVVSPRGGRRMLDDVVLSPDGGTIAVTYSPTPTGITENVSHQVLVLNATDLTERALLDLGDRSVGSLVFSVDNDRLIALTSAIKPIPGEPDRALMMWTTKDFSVERSVPLSDTPITMALTPDGRSLLTAGMETRVHVRDARTGEVLQEFGEHPSAIRAIAVSPDGATVATGTIADPVLRLWDLRSGTLKGRYTGHGPDSLNEVAFSPDGKSIASAGADGRIGLWPTEVHAAITRICTTLSYQESPEECQ
ncbi:NACHT and WD repeat domain-containing protein [Saccharothrix algeriensis]|uniref:WD40 repeat protein n=2 Tax=Saccharothrix algeriensis TaxID=173560 RepID=A0ABS2S1A9_9PSEU|nr:hypothetical protein [Saccharothrix algeriensis]MBM7809689.1 WD40 repeat protein [Saccharothrix algeriensis]